MSRGPVADFLMNATGRETRVVWAVLVETRPAGESFDI